MIVNDIDKDGLLFIPSVSNSNYEDESDSFFKKLFAKKKHIEESFFESRIKEFGYDTLYDELSDHPLVYWVEGTPRETMVILTNQFLMLPDKEIFALDKISKYAMYNIYDTPFAQYAIDRKDYPYDPLYVSEYEGEESFELDRFKVQFVIVDVYGLRYEYEFLMETKDRRNFHDAFVSRCKGIDFTSNAVIEGTFEDDYLITERI